MFNQVYELVILSDDIGKLKNGIKNLNMDAKAFKNGVLLTVAAQLVLEKNPKVEWLEKLGARADYIAQSYAFLGDDKKVEKYRKKDASVNFIARGYALADNREEVNKYCTTYDAKCDYIAQGYAIAGNFQEVESYIQKGANVKLIIHALVLSGHHQQVQAYYEKDPKLIKEIIYGYARVGDKNRIQTYLAPYLHDEKFLKKINNVLAQGYADSGQHELVEDCRKKGADINLIAYHYAEAGYCNKVDYYALNYAADVSRIACAYARSGHHVQVEKYRKKGADPKLIVEQYALSGYFEEVQDYQKEFNIPTADIAYFYAKAGYHNGVETYRINSGNSPLILNNILKGYAEAGYQQNINQYLNKRIFDVAKVVACYIDLKQPDQAEAYLKAYLKNSIDDEYIRGLIPHVAACFTKAGYHEKAKTYYKLNAKWNTIEAYNTPKAQGDEPNIPATLDDRQASPKVPQEKTSNKNETKKVPNHLGLNPLYATNLTKANVSFSKSNANQNTQALNKNTSNTGPSNTEVSTFPLKGTRPAKTTTHSSTQFEKINELCQILDNYLEARKAIRDRSGKTKDYFYWGLLKFFQKSYTQKYDAVIALKSTLQGNPVNLNQHLSALRNGKLGNILRKFIKAEGGMSIVSQDVHTIREFIAALEENPPPKSKTFSK